MANTVLITGASRGIGLELAYQYARDGAQVHACARDLLQAEHLQALAAKFPEQIELHYLDVTSDSQIKALDRALGDTSIDVLIHNAGCYGPRRIKFGEIDRQIWRQVLEVNTLSPLMLSQALYARVAASQQKTLAMISSKVGSITDNQSGGGYYYRSSKTALNQVVKSLSIDLSGFGVRVIALHPGWVQTAMGGPNALITTEESAKGIIQVIEDKNNYVSGGFYNYNGDPLPGNLS
ncbi:short-chain dehydrogenase [Nitrincola sp. A-D6]|uniref:SDR family oxidoreductase n=1 Tax=Nitrincola sp. A-D6 TaxID=1545442 RepID=UPI00051FA8D9|nr:SDR family oxidoreductase [Nitrincola sp. A-D6]KGK42555.1 short-chain dehydrogenase [Nitrincola sp. A-D6]